MSEGLLEGRVAVVTGASRGIGAAIAERLGAEGATVVLAARTAEPGGHRLPGSLAETAEAVRRAGGQAVVVPTDLARREDRQALAESARAVGPVEVLVHNAAVTFFEPVASFELRRAELMFEVQVMAAVHLAQLFLPEMRTRRRGWICLVSSLASRHPTIPPPERAQRGVGTVYGMCKAALERLATGLAAEVFDDGIAVNAVSPARVVPTPGTLFHGLVRPEDTTQVVEGPEVMAEAVLALVTGDPRRLTGRIVLSAELLEELGRSATPLAGTGA